MGFLIVLRRHAALTAAVLVLAGCRAGISLETPPVRDADDWPQLGGGAERDDFTDTRLPDRLALRWRMETTGGQAGAAPLAMGGLIAVTSVTGGVDFYDASSGRERGYIAVNAVVHGTPAFLDSLLVLPFAASESTLGCVDLLHGRAMWEKSIGNVDAGLLAYRGYVIAGSLTGDVACIRAADSAIVWHRKLPKPVRAAAAASDSTVLVPCTNGDLYALALRDGSELWRRPTGSALLTPPVVSGEHAIVCSRAGDVQVFDIRTGSVHWKRDLGSAVVAAYAPGTGVVIAGTDGAIRCLDPAEGREIWSYRGSAAYLVPPVIAGDRVVAASVDGWVRVLGLSAGDLRWSARVDGRIRSPILAYRGMVYVCSDDRTISAFGAAQ